MDNIKRIEYYEKLFDEVSEKVSKISEKDFQKEEYAKLIPKIKELTAYYESKEWKEDFEADEKGLLPKNLKRGILSEDGIYNLLEELSDFIYK